ncbi:MAG: transposase [Chloroflexi bacterium]|nr:transposase [Chloroflexota bacterium]
MTRRSVLEYVQAVQDRYSRGSKLEKGRILNEFIQVTGMHRKAAIRLLNRGTQSGTLKRRGRKRKYSREVVVALAGIWEASDRLCSARLKPFLPEMVRVLRRQGEQRISSSLEKELCSMSESTIDRFLRPYRKLGGRKRFSTTRPGSLLKSSIPIRTFADWQENKPGFMELDTVAHCGDNTEGFYLYTLSAVDIETGWTECLPVWGKYQEKVRQSIHHMRSHLSFPLLGIDSDNGAEFINQCLWKYCRDEKITFTRTRAYKKNDSCHVEQKNGQIVRRLVGYDRYSTRAAYDCLGRIYDLARLYINFFQPTMKLVSKTRHGAKVHKIYDIAQTPYQRLLQTGILADAKKSALAATYQGLNPVRLLEQINDNLKSLWRLADRPTAFGNRNYDSTRRASVTV